MAKCDDARAAYDLLILDGMDIESKVAEDCQNQHDLIIFFRLMFIGWVAIAGQALLCQILAFGLWLCDALFVIAFVAAFMLFLVLLWIYGLTLRLRKNKKKCREVNQSLTNAFNKVKQDCPQEKWPKQLFQANCAC